MNTKTEVIEVLNDTVELYNAYKKEKQAIANDNDLSYEGKDNHIKALTETYKTKAQTNGTFVIDALKAVIELHKKEDDKQVQDLANNSGHQAFINNSIQLLKSGRVTEKDMAKIKAGIGNDYLAIKMINMNIPQNSSVNPIELPTDKVEFVISMVIENITVYLLRSRNGNVHGAVLDCIEKLECFNDNFKYIGTDDIHVVKKNKQIDSTDLD